MTLEEFYMVVTAARARGAAVVTLSIGEAEDLVETILDAITIEIPETPSVMLVSD